MVYCPDCGQVVDFAFLHIREVVLGFLWQSRLACLPDEEREDLAEGVRIFLKQETKDEIKVSQCQE